MTFKREGLFDEGEQVRAAARRDDDGSTSPGPEGKIDLPPPGGPAPPGSGPRRPPGRAAAPRTGPARRADSTAPTGCPGRAAVPPPPARAGAAASRPSRGPARWRLQPPPRPWSISTPASRMPTVPGNERMKSFIPPLAAAASGACPSKVEVVSTVVPPQPGRSAPAAPSRPSPGGRTGGHIAAGVAFFNHEGARHAPSRVYRPPANTHLSVAALQEGRLREPSIELARSGRPVLPKWVAGCTDCRNG